MDILTAKSNLADPTTSANDIYNDDASYHEKLDSKHVDIPDNEHSVPAEMIMLCTSKIGRFVSPKTLIKVFRLLKLITFCCLLLTILSEVIYIIVMICVDVDLLKIIGGTRDAMLRGYAIILAIFAVFIERDMELVDIYYPGMKSFIPRSLLLSFISFLTCTVPLLRIGLFNFGNATLLQFQGFYGFSVTLQSLASYSLWLSACTYFLFGILCLDRFTADAFIADGHYAQSKDQPEKVIQTITFQRSTGETEHKMNLSGTPGTIGNLSMKDSEEYVDVYKPPIS